MKLKTSAIKEIYKKIKILIIKLEKKMRDYFSAKGADIYTRFVRRMFFVLTAAAVTAVIIIGVILSIASIAKPLAKVPDVKGMNVLEAAIEVQKKGLTLEVDTKFDPATDRFTVIDQYPGKGATVRKGRAVTLVVSMGKDVYITPNLTGKSREEAEKMLNELNISYEITVLQSADFALDTVVSQDIPPKTEKDRNVKIKLLVNSDVGRGDFRISDYTKQSVDNVVKTLVFNSIQPLIEKVPSRNPDEDGFVLSQSVSAGTVVPKNSDIRLQVGVYGEDDLEAEKYNYYVFSYYFAPPASENSNQNNSTNIAEEQQTVKIILSDEKNTQAEIFNKSVRYGETIALAFKAFGKAKLSLIVNNNFVKEIPYE
jgi:serine/threonine-protein kinase